MTVGPESPVGVVRDELAAWLTNAEPIISAMFERRESGLKEAFEMWTEKLERYESLCRREPENLVWQQAA